MKVSANDIAPSPDFLKSKTVGYIFDCVQKGELDNLPPAPIVRPAPAKNFSIPR